MSLHLAIEAVGVRHSGGATVLQDFVAAAESDSRFDRISVFCTPRRERRFDFIASEKLREIDTEAGRASPAARLFWLYRQLPAQMASTGAEVLISMSGTGLAAAGKPHLPFIQQSLPFSSEAMGVMPWPEKLRFRTIYEAMRFSCRRSSAILVQTDAMKRAVVRAFGVEPERVHSVSCCVREQTDSSESSDRLEAMRRAAPGFRLLYVGNDSAYKNVGNLLKSAAELARRFPELRLFLTWPTDHPAARQGNVICTGFLDDAAVREAYRLADLLVMPSLTETVGFPLLEAMTLGTPVLAADRPYAREVCEDAAEFFEPLSADSLSSAIVRLLEDRDRRTELVKRGLALTKRQRGANPYRRMLDLAAGAAGIHNPGALLAGPKGPESPGFD